MEKDELEAKEELELTDFGWKDENGVEYATDEEYYEAKEELKEDKSQILHSV